MRYRAKEDNNLLLDIMFTWRYDEDTDMMVSSGINPDFIRLCSLAMLIVVILFVI